VEDNKTPNAIKAEGGDVIFVKCDVSKDGDLKMLLYKTTATYGRLHYAFNNAGIEGTMAPTADCAEENLDKTMNVNLKGIWLCMKYEIPLMLKEKKEQL
jgi:NAD(P)-dependent dehydrogenase (short-subunit alcohol dehydrogenase family)